MANKDFKVGKRFLARGFDKVDGGCGFFVSLRIGGWSELAVEMRLEPDEARELARALESAAAFAEGPRVGTSADLGYEEAA